MAVALRRGLQKEHGIVAREAEQRDVAVDPLTELRASDTSGRRCAGPVIETWPRPTTTPETVRLDCRLMTLTTSPSVPFSVTTCVVDPAVPLSVSVTVRRSACRKV